MKFYRKKSTVLVITLFLYMGLFSAGRICGLSRLQVGQEFKPFTLRTLSGKNLNYKKYVGKNNVGLIFWKIPEGSDFKDYSKDALKALNKIYSKYESRGFKVIAVYCPWGDSNVTKKELDTINSMIEELNVSFPVVLDYGLQVYNNLGVSALPSFVLINKKSRVDFILPGYPSHSAEEIMNKEVEKIFKEAKMLNNKLAKKY